MAVFPVEKVNRLHFSIGFSLCIISFKNYEKKFLNKFFEKYFHFYWKFDNSLFNELATALDFPPRTFMTLVMVVDIMVPTV